MKRLDADGLAIITVADLVSYLSTLPQDAQVSLDKDGWMCNELPWESPDELIRQRGIFFYNPRYRLLTINN